METNSLLLLGENEDNTLIFCMCIIEGL